MYNTGLFPDFGTKKKSGGRVVKENDGGGEFNYDIL
jgi:hypothetical protein